MAIVGRVGESEHFRNVKRHKVITWSNLLLIRVDESLHFSNTRYLEDRLLAAVADQPKVHDEWLPREPDRWQFCPGVLSPSDT